MMILLLIFEFLILIAVGVLVVFRMYEMYHFRTAPYVPSNKQAMEDMIALAGDVDGLHVLELGSGDGGLCILAGKAGATALGIESNPFLFVFARWNARRNKVGDRVTFERKNFWNTRFSAETNVVFVYLLPSTMERLYPKLLAELKPGTVIVSNTFRFPHLQPVHVSGKCLKYILPPHP